LRINLADPEEKAGQNRGPTQQTTNILIIEDQSNKSKSRKELNKHENKSTSNHAWIY